MYDKLFGLPSCRLNQRPWHKKASSDARPSRDFRRKSERRKGRGVLRGSAPGIKISPTEMRSRHKTQNIDMKKVTVAR